MLALPLLEDIPGRAAVRRQLPRSIPNHNTDFRCRIPSAVSHTGVARYIGPMAYATINRSLR